MSLPPTYEGEYTKRHQIKLPLLCVSLQTLFRVWDCLFYEGTKVLFRVGLTLLKLHEARLLECRDFMETMTALREIPRSPQVLQCHTFMQVNPAEGVGRIGRKVVINVWTSGPHQFRRFI